MRRRLAYRIVLWSAGLLLVVSGCREAAPAMEDGAPASAGAVGTTSRPVSTPHPPVATAAGISGSPAPGGRPAARLVFEAPEGWVEETPSGPLRMAQYTLAGGTGGAAAAQLVVFHFGAAGAGSVQANLDRWCSQIEQPDGRPSRAMAVVTRREVGGLAVDEIDLSGTYVAETFPGSGERVHRPDQRMLASIVLAEGAYYIKLVGPAATVAEHVAAYRAFVDSLRPAP